jgi:hypothetical protein
MKQTDVSATVTDTTSGTIAALPGNPRTHNHTFGNLPHTAIAASSKFPNVGSARKRTIEVAVNV